MFDKSVYDLAVKLARKELAKTAKRQRKATIRVSEAGYVLDALLASGPDVNRRA